MSNKKIDLNITLFLQKNITDTLKIQAIHGA